MPETPEPEPELTSATVVKVWHDNDNAENMRPASIQVTLTANGRAVQQVTLSGDNWTATVGGLPAAQEDGTPIVYGWTEQEVSGYALESAVTAGTVTTLTNRYVPVVVEVPPDEPQPQQPKKGKWIHSMIFEEYMTPLGGEWLINHVGDCFD